MMPMGMPPPQQPQMPMAPPMQEQSGMNPLLMIILQALLGGGMGGNPEMGMEQPMMPPPPIGLPSQDPTAQAPNFAELAKKRLMSRGM